MFIQINFKQKYTPLLLSVTPVASAESVFAVVVVEVVAVLIVDDISLVTCVAEVDKVPVRNVVKVVATCEDVTTISVEVVPIFITTRVDECTFL